MAGAADLRFGAGRLGGEPLQSLTAHATFAGSTVNFDKVDAAFDAGHIVANGTYDTQAKAFDLSASGDRIMLDRLEALIGNPNLPKLTGTAVVTSLKASGVLNAKDFSSYLVEFNAESNNATLDGRSA